jgi:two-component system NtrC family sensor kinase
MSAHLPKASQTGEELQTRLIEAEKSFRMVTELPSLGILMLDCDHRVTFANRWASEITGFDTARIIGMDFLALFRPLDRQAITGALSQEGDQEVLELTIWTAKGRTKIVEFSCVVDRDQDDTLRYYVSLRDISQRKAVERAAHEANDKLRKITEMGEIGVLVYDQDFRIEFANQMAAEITGQPVAGLLGAEITQFLDRDNRLYLKGLYSPLHLEEHRHLCTEMPIVRGDGDTKTVEICLAISRGTEGEIKTYAYLRDLTERIRMENELRKTNEFLQKVIRSSVDGIIAADMKGNIIIFNEGAERLLGYTAEEVLGRIHITELYPPGMAKEIMQRMRGAAYGSQGKLPTTPTTLVAKSGEHIPVHISAAIVYEGNHEVASVGIFTDLRERIKMQHQLEETYKQLLQSEKLASLGKLAAGVAHEINNPLGGILMYANMMLEQARNDQTADLREIVEQTVRCKEIVQSLLDFARKGGEDKQPVQLNQLIDKCVALLENQALFLNIAIEKEYDPDLPLIHAEPGQMNQVFTNLLVNGAQAMDGKGTLGIRTWHEDPPSAVHVEVSDTGCGIPDEHLAEIFDPFFTTKEVGRGTGLGLSTTYGIVRRHGGEIQVRSCVGKGTTFHLKFSNAAPSASAAPQSDSQGEAGEERIGGLQTT